MSTTIQTVPSSLLNTMNGTTATSATSSTTSTSSASNPTGMGSAADLQNNFLTMLVTQMQNQNPLNPMDNAEVTSQMAQLSTVTGISQMNATLSNLISSYQSSQNMQAAGLIGKDVVVPGNQLTLYQGQSQLGVELPSDATDVTVTISNSQGQVVDTLNAGALPTGVNAVQWDGRTTAGTTAPDGQYTFTVTATNGTSPVQVTPLSVGVVQSVSTGSTGAMLNIPNIGPTSFSSVLQIL